MSFARKIEELKEFILDVWRYGLGKVGLILAISIIIISIAAAVTIPPGFSSNWFNPSYWADYPQLAPPAWVTYFGVQKAHHKVVEFYGYQNHVINTGRGFIMVTYSMTYHLRMHDFPQNVMAEFKGDVMNLEYYSSHPLPIVINVTRPDGYTITVFQGAVPTSTINTSPISPSPSVTISSLAPLIAKYTPLSQAEFLSAYANKLVEGGIYEQFIFGIPKLVNGTLLATPLTGVYKVTLAIVLPSPHVLKQMLSQPGLSEQQKKIIKEMLHDVNVIEKNGVTPKVKLVVVGDCYGLLGTDRYGRDLALGIFYGFPIAVLVGFFAAVLATFIGGVVGVVSGYYGGMVDEVVQRLIDISVNIPLLPILVLIGFIVQKLFLNPWIRVFVVIAFLIAFSWGGTAIVVRSMALSIKAEPYVEAARAAGASNVRIIFRHVFPQVVPYLFAVLVFSVPGAVLTIAGLSVLGIRFGLPSWGSILADLRSYVQQAGPSALMTWWWLVPPGAMLALLSFTFIALGIAMETVVEPRLRR
ncbi:MAG: ABC transporter permease [Crenarchaeota archaeon]|nr:ABC transporter permease [Thermoproteota archaeon]